MRRILLLLSLVLFSVLFVPVVSAESPAGYPSVDDSDPRQLKILGINGFLGRANNIDCSDVKRCAELYSVERRKYGDVVLPKVSNVTRADNRTLQVQLSERLPLALDGLVLVAANLEFQIGPSDYKSKRVEFTLAASVSQDPASRRRLRFYPRSPLFVSQLDDLVARVKVIATDTDSHTQTTRTLSSIRPFHSDIPRSTHEPLYGVILVLRYPLPSGSLNVTVSGLPGGDVTGSVKVTALTKDKANIYLNGQFVLNHLDEDSYAIEAKLSPVSWDLGPSWDLSPLLEVNVGATALKKPDTYHVALQAGHYWTSARGSAFTFIASADYLPDKKFETQDAGGTFGLSADLPLLQRPLWMARVLASPKEKDKGASATSPHWGYSVTPSASIEAGVHLRSLSDEVENHSYLRARISLAALIEFEKFTLDTSGELRHLFTKEVILNKSTAVHTGEGDMGYVRGEFGYSLSDMLKLSAKHEWGNLPPTFKTTSATTFGITIIY